MWWCCVLCCVLCCVAFVPSFSGAVVCRVVLWCGVCYVLFCLSCVALSCVCVALSLTTKGECAWQRGPIGPSI